MPSGTSYFWLSLKGYYILLELTEGFSEIESVNAGIEPK